MTAASLFTVDGAECTPTELSRGPWSPDALHGGPVAAILARGVEQAPDDGIAFDVARLTIELTRPTPLAPLLLTANVVRPGRKVQLVEATLTIAATGVEVARARALRIRRAPVALPVEDPVMGPLLVPDPPPPGPDGVDVAASSWAEELTSFHRDANELRFAGGSFDQLGAVTVWVRLRHPVVAGEATTGVQRAAAASDFGNGISHILPFEDYTFINPDLTVHLLRAPRGEWVGLDTRSHLGGGQGVGMAESEIYDAEGRIGRAVQSILVDAR